MVDFRIQRRPAMFGRRVLIAALILSALGASGAEARPRHHASAKATCPDIVGRALVRQDVECALRRWFDDANAHRPDRITDLYAEHDPLLLSTLDPNPLTSRGQIRIYFDKLLAKPGFHVTPSTVHRDKIDLGREMAADSGFYTFAWDDGAVPKYTPSRFTFVFVLKPGARQLTIATHHSSKEP
jgi:hypothetical protein